MNPVTALLTTAAVAAGTITAPKAFRKRMKQARDQIEQIRLRERARKNGTVLDLEADENGVFGLKDSK